MSNHGDTVRHVLLGVSGSIAAYKSADMASKLVQKGYSVHVVMTAAAQQFIAPLTFSSLTGNDTITGKFGSVKDYEAGHIPLAKRCEVLIVAPATANVIGKIANGIADDFLTSVIMATRSPVIIAPAMNDAMFTNAIFQKNLRTLVDSGYHIVGPAEGYLACGTKGVGRLAPVDDIIARAEALLGQKNTI